MIRFGVVADNVVDVGRVGQGRDVGQELVGEGFLGRIDQGDFLVADEIGVVGGTVRRFITVKISHGPVDVAYPVDLFQQTVVHRW